MIVSHNASMFMQLNNTKTYMQVHVQTQFTDLSLTDCKCPETNVFCYQLIQHHMVHMHKFYLHFLLFSRNANCQVIHKITLILNVVILTIF